MYGESILTVSSGHYLGDNWSVSRLSPIMRCRKRAFQLLVLDLPWWLIDRLVASRLLGCHVCRERAFQLSVLELSVVIDWSIGCSYILGSLSGTALTYLLQSWALAHFFEVRYSLPTQFFPMDRWRSCVHFLSFPFRSNARRSADGSLSERAKSLIALYYKTMYSKCI